MALKVRGRSDEFLVAASSNYHESESFFSVYRRGGLHCRSGFLCHGPGPRSSPWTRFTPSHDDARRPNDVDADGSRDDTDRAQLLHEREQSPDSAKFRCSPRSKSVKV